MKNQNEDAQNELSGRPAGIVCLVAFVASVVFGIYLPISEALAHAPKVRYHAEFAVLSPALLVFGVIQLAMGERTKELMGDQGRASWTSIVLTVLLLAAGLGIYLWLGAFIKSQGYK